MVSNSILNHGMADHFNLYFYGVLTCNVMSEAVCE